MSNTAGKDSVIAKIKALFARTTENGCTEAEAVASALAAQRLIPQYNVLDDELSERGPSAIAEVRSAPVSRNWAGPLADVVSRSFGCESYLFYESRRGGKKVFVFMGDEANASAARSTFDFLYRVGSRLANDEARRQRDLCVVRCTRGIRPSFCMGFVQGVEDEFDRQSAALMVVVPKRVTDAFDKRVAGCAAFDGRSSIANPTAYSKGWHAGREAAQERSGSRNGR